MESFARRFNEGENRGARSVLESVILKHEGCRSLRASDEYFRAGGQGIPFEQVVADLGFTMEQIRRVKKGQ